MQTISYIYFPSGNLFWGHAKMQIEEHAHALIISLGRFKISYKRPFEPMIQTAKSYGLPFCQYTMQLSSDQMERLKKKLGRSTHITCAQGINASLSECVDFNIPFPLNMSPLLTASYLSASKALGNRRITQIKWVRNDSKALFVAKAVTGIIGEIFIVVALAYMTILAVRLGLRTCSQV